MPGRTLLFVAIVIMAGAAPFLFSSRSDSKPSADKVAGDAKSSSLEAFWKRLSGTAVATDKPDVKAADPSLDAARSLIAENRQLLAGQPVKILQLAGTPGVTLADALRFDVTPAWVSTTWPRVTTQRLETGWYGMRAPLVTGTEPDDVVGAVTYYFNTQNYVERITLYGYTGNAEPLISLVQQQYGLSPYAAVGRGLFLSFNGTQAIGVLQVEDAPLPLLDRNGSRYRVQLELNLPRPGAELSPELMDKLRKLHDAKLL
jgi:hypothetical protein